MCFQIETRANRIAIKRNTSYKEHLQQFIASSIARSRTFIAALLKIVNSSYGTLKRIILITDIE